MIYSDFSTMSRRKREYDGLKNTPYYKAFRKQVPIIGTWDDHDYAYNNKDGTYRSKVKSLALACSFLDIPNENPDGIYRSSLITRHKPGGEPGSWNMTIAHVLSLDLRFNQSKNRGELLGEKQWLWLESKLTESSNADITILASSQNTGYGWHKFPKEQARLYRTLETVNSNVVVLSGDRHMGEFCRLPTRKTIFEIMSSGLTHTRNGNASPHAAQTFRQPNFGILEVSESGWLAQLYSSVTGKLLGQENQ